MFIIKSFRNININNIFYKLSQLLTYHKSPFVIEYYYIGIGKRDDWFDAFVLVEICIL
jgi:hypothetical protein